MTISPVAEQGIDLAQARRCIESWCKCRLQHPGPEGGTGSVDPAHIGSLAARLEAKPDLAAAVSRILTQLVRDMP